MPHTRSFDEGTEARLIAGAAAIRFARRRRARALTLIIRRCDCRAWIFTEMIRVTAAHRQTPVKFNP